MDHRTLKFITQFRRVPSPTSLRSNIHNETVSMEIGNMIGAITCYPCLMCKNLHKKAFNFEHYNVVCCQSQSQLCMRGCVR